jgi:uncharacterized damage-inducible protein DinB
MDLKTAAIQVLEQLLDITEQIEKEDFTLNIPLLNASIGQHTRHIVEFYLCLFEGLKEGRVNYDQRRRDKMIESDKIIALEAIRVVINSIRNNDINPCLRLEVMYGDNSSRILSLETNYERELVYNIEHTIHHMAIVKQGLYEICRYIKLPENFGVASSTTRYSRQV